MTEAEWLTCEDLSQLIKSQRDLGKGRKLRLFAVACCRRVWGHLPAGLARDAVEVAESSADGGAGEAQLGEVQRAAREAWAGANLELARVVTTGMAVSAPEAGIAALYASTYAPGVAVPAGTSHRKAALATEREAQLALFRDIFGNPFRPVTLDPNWLTSTAVALARQMYESRDFSAMPILADALQDAGCDNTDILGHCRGPGPHVRGCWVVDLVWGKE